MAMKKNAKTDKIMQQESTHDFYYEKKIMEEASNPDIGITVKQIFDLKFEITAILALLLQLLQEKGVISAEERAAITDENNIATSVQRIKTMFDASLLQQEEANDLEKK